ncbi:MAG TPA: glycine cleavage system aminomethyltransferase GcvT [Hyphomicrobiaceae bacterium]|nr:glycine cleavage system aminomethyltransferase GcvT [Hyphomicrobiaceae bacterium]
MTDNSGSPLRRTPLYDEHVRLGAKMVPFAGYEMPVQYPLGVLKEHLWTRDKAGLFDVSHMGIAYVHAADHRHETAARALEALCPADFVNLAPGQQRYSQLLAADGGILDDLMVARPVDPAHAGTLCLVVNAGCKVADYAHIAAHLPSGVTLAPSDDFALLALQGPAAVAVLSDHDRRVAGMGFMTTGAASIAGVDVGLSRSGYTGEDGCEIFVPVEKAAGFWRSLAGDARVQPIGLGARDSLRLEAGLCLYGHDIDTTTSPIEAGLAWSIQKRRRVEGGFPGAARVQRELRDGPSRLRVGIRPDGRAPAREGTEIRAKDGRVIGKITSGGFGPTANAPVAMGYVERASAALGTYIDLMVRGKPLPATIAAMPFTPHRYARKTT